MIYTWGFEWEHRHSSWTACFLIPKTPWHWPGFATLLLALGPLGFLLSFGWGEAPKYSNKQGFHSDLSKHGDIIWYNSDNSDLMGIDRYIYNVDNLTLLTTMGNVPATNETGGKTTNGRGLIRQLAGPLSITSVKCVSQDWSARSICITLW